MIKIFTVIKRELQYKKYPMNVVIEGCLHGELQEVYNQIRQLENQLNIKVDLLIICGDFQALRDQTDLDYLHCPPKYKSMGSFYKYFQSQADPPVLTVFIGGNHEAVNYMRNLYFGGWVAKNIYYLGQAGSINVSKGSTKIRISGMSGIYNHRDFQYILKPQRTPLYGNSKISAYHIKQLQVYRMELLSRLSQLKKEDPKTYGNHHSNFDIFLSHDWPKNIALFGKTSQLYKYKPFLEKEINSGVFGSPPSQRLMKLAKPSYWFSAHMHVKYAAIYPHSQKQFTHFLSLDKCLQKRSCMQVLHFKSPANQSKEIKDFIQISLDKTWLTVLNLTENLHNKGQVLYVFDDKSQEYKLVNSKMMNELIMRFPQTYKTLFGEQNQQNQNYSDKIIKAPDFDEDNQFSQTQKILDLCKIQNLKQFQGIIFPKGYFEYQKGVFQKENIQESQQKSQVLLEKKEEASKKMQNLNDEIDLDL